MNLTEATKAMRSYFGAQYNNLTQVRYDDQNAPAANNATWVRFTIKHADGFQASIGSPGSNKFRKVGNIIIQIFQPQGQASIDARAKADVIEAIFRGKDYQGIHFFDVCAQEIGNDGHGWYQINVKVKFQYDSIT